MHAAQQLISERPAGERFWVLQVNKIVMSSHILAHSPGGFRDVIIFCAIDLEEHTYYGLCIKMVM